MRPTAAGENAPGADARAAEGGCQSNLSSRCNWSNSPTRESGHSGRERAPLLQRGHSAEPNDRKALRHAFAVVGRRQPDGWP